MQHLFWYACRGRSARSRTRGEQQRGRQRSFDFSARRPGFLHRSRQLVTETERDGGVRTGLGTTPPSLRPSLPPALPGMMAPGPLSARSLSTAQTLASAARRVEMTELIKQINEIGLRSLLFLCVTLGFVGAILV